MLLAGDAAHVHSPLGGQGLNLGIMDAVNLGWKLAAVLRGFGGDELLDTYTRERHPVGAAVLNNTRAHAALLAPSPQVMALREIMSDLMDIPDVKDYLGRMLSGVGVRYPLPYDAGTDHELLGGHVPDSSSTTTPDQRRPRVLRLVGGCIGSFPWLTRLNRSADTAKIDCVTVPRRLR